MDIDTFIHEAIFGEKEQHRIFYYLMWENLQEVGYVITDESGYEIDSVFKAVALQNLVGEFAYRLYDTVNETGYEDVLEYLGTLAIGEDDILQYCENDPEILVEPEDFELTVKNALDTITERTADKLLEEFSADDLFDYLFTATYDFEQDFTYEFEDTDEFQAFVDSNADQLDNYKEEYPAVMRWVEGGMVCLANDKYLYKKGPGFRSLLLCIVCYLLLLFPLPTLFPAACSCWAISAKPADMAEIMRTVSSLV